MNRLLLRFGDCTLDIAARELRRAGERVDLPPVVFDCIAYLVAHRDRAVGRDELVAAVWAKATISDTMLGKAILAARRAVGDTAEAQAFLRTVPRFGYHWVASTIETGADEATPAQAPRATPPVPAPTIRRRWYLPVIVLLVAAAIVGAGARWWRHVAPVPSAAVEAGAARAPETVAVLPADVVSEAADDWLRLGVMDLLATRLRSGGITAMPSDSVVRIASSMRSSDEAIAALATAGATRGLVVPAVRLSGTSWIVRAELVEPTGQRRAVQAEADNPIRATEQVAQRLLALLGRAPAEMVVPRDLTLTELLQRTDAARLSENLDLARSLIANAPASMRALPEVRERAIRIDLRSGRFDQARSAIETLLAEVSKETDPVMHARLLENLCVVHLRSGRLPDARSACDEAIRLLEGAAEPIALGRAYNDRGILNAREGNAAAALADFSHSRVALTLGVDPLLMAQLDGNESTVQMAQGRPAEALPALDRAGEMFRRFGMINEFVVSVVNQIGAHLQLLQPVEALKAGDAAWTERGRITDPQVRDAFEVARADSLAATGRIAEARTLLDATIHRTDPPADAGQAAHARAIEARLDLAAGEAGTATVLAKQAVDGLAGPGDEADRADAWLTLLRAGRVDDATGATQEAAAFAAWAASSKDPRVRVRADVARAEEAAAKRDAAATTAAFDAALAGTDGRAELVAEVATAYGNFLIGEGRLDAAAVIAGRVARAAEQDFGCALLQVRLYRALGREGPWRAALERARALAGERAIPDALQALVPSGG